MEKDLTELMKNTILREKLIKEINEIRKNLCVEEEKLNTLKIKLDEAKLNKDKIEEMSLNIMLSILSDNDDEKTSLNHEAYFTIKNQYNLCKDIVDNYKSDLKKLEKEKSQLEISDAELNIYNKYIDKLEKEIKSEDAKIKLKENIEYLNGLIKKLVDIEASVVACDKCKTVLRNAVSHLNSAKNWGVCKTANNDNSASFKKHNKITTGKKELNKFNYELKILNYELTELNKDSYFIGLKLSRIFYNFNILYDNIFSDVSIQIHIKRTLKRLTDEKYKLDELYTELKKNKFLIEDKILICNKELLNNI